MDCNPSPARVPQYPLIEGEDQQTIETEYGIQEITFRKSTLKSRENYAPCSSEHKIVARHAPPGFAHCITLNPA